MTISEIAKGDRINGIDVLVEQRTDGVGKDGRPFLNLSLRDQTGCASGKIWSENVPAFGHLFKEGALVNISGDVGEWQGKLQITIKDAAQSLADASKYFKTTLFDIEKMWSDLVALVGSMKEPLTKFVAEELLLNEGISNAYKKAPAAKAQHNAWIGGLLEHVHSLCTIAEPIVRHYQKPEYCEKISRDKVLFGLMLHDAGKIIEYDYMTPTFNYTPVGKLTNHIVLGASWVFETANKYKEKDRLSNFKMERAHLMHILAAHHGKQEYGSPMVPVTLEAILVHHLDNLDAKMLHALDFVKGKPGPIAGFSQKDWADDKPVFLQYS
jgi:3'-5' exoribonuclease